MSRPARGAHAKESLILAELTLQSFVGSLSTFISHSPRHFMHTQTCRWGILGAAFIARKNWQAIRDAGNATLIAVASRDLNRARTFIAECQASSPHPQLPEAMDSYEALLARPDIDAVYIPLPTGIRKDWVLRAAAAGKHVLVEKPVGSTATEVEEMLAACEKHGVQFMDGVMFMHSTRLTHLQSLLEKQVGRVRHIATQFSFLAEDDFQSSNIRAHGHLEPLGCLGDLGWYCLRFTLWAMGYATPTHITGRLHALTQGDADSPPVPLEFSGTLTFAEGASASFYCSFTAAHAQWAMVSGDQGLLHVPDFVLPFSDTQTRFELVQSQFALDGCRTDMHEHRSITNIDEPSSNATGSQEARMFQTFSALVLEHRREDSWPQISLLTQRVLDACLRSAREGSSVISLG